MYEDFLLKIFLADTIHVYTYVLVLIQSILPIAISSFCYSISDLYKLLVYEILHHISYIMYIFLIIIYTFICIAVNCWFHISILYSQFILFKNKVCQSFILQTCNKWLIGWWIIQSYLLLHLSEISQWKQ